MIEVVNCHKKTTTPARACGLPPQSNYHVGLQRPQKTLASHKILAISYLETTCLERLVLCTTTKCSARMEEEGMEYHHVIFLYI